MPRLARRSMFDAIASGLQGGCGGCAVGARRAGAIAAAASAAAFGGRWRWQPARCSSGSSATSPSAAPAERQATRLTRHARIVPYGILGSGSGGKVAEPPDAHTAFVDPAGLHHVQGNGPSGAGGAAGVIYRWLGIAEDDSFPPPVKAAIKAPLFAKFHEYGDKKCIHVIGPDFRKRQYSRDDAISELTIAYKNVLVEFCSSGLRSLRLLPVSGGIFSGPFKDQLPLLTAQALEEAFGSLSLEQRSHVLESDVAMCIFMASEVSAFEEAFS
eukprot:TRINITY_DN4219_c0_g1_i1.p1 TRINITY_DN4219_c0_g1~~TRINITY_DN4219_c0_g1_i1.p1  ORF type:complete len:291 (+),score=58.99 TRINITY_DN4219_c0_g1_i1:62-874(+)